MLALFITLALAAVATATDTATRADCCSVQHTSCAEASDSTCPAYLACMQQCNEACSASCSIRCLLDTVPQTDHKVQTLLQCQAKHCPANKASDASAAAATTTATSAPHRLNQDFSMLPELKDAGFALDGSQRVQWQLRRWRRGPTFGVLENKLLGHTLLDALALPQQEVLYGAFATKALGRWPKYSRAELVKVVSGDPSHAFVLKSATNGGNADVLVMTPAKWDASSWTADKVADYAEQFLHGKWFSEWGQKYEHRGVIMQANALTPDQDGSSSAAKGKLLFEVKVHAVFGQLGMGRLQALPFNGDQFIDVQFTPSSGVSCIGSRGYEEAERAALCTRIEPLLNREAAHLGSVASKVQKAYGADWFRFDAFLKESGELSINEISYPSHIGDFEGAEGHDASRQLLAATYKGEQYSLASNAGFLADLLAATGIDAYEFLVNLDYHTMRHAQAGVYDSSLWPDWSPEKEDAEAAASKAEHDARVSRLHTVTHRCVALVVIVAVAIIAFSCKPAATTTTTTTITTTKGTKGAKGSIRLPVLDNAKFLCITVVIYGHFLYYNIDQFGAIGMPLADQATWLSGATDMMLFVMGSTNWGINMLCFLSGYVTKKPLSDAYAQRFFMGLVVPTVMWLCFAKPVLLKIMMWPSLSTVRQAFGEFCSGTAFHHEWYLEALILWRLFAFFLRPMRPAAAIALALVVASVGGYFDIGEAGFFSWDHAVGYLPLFIAGMFTPLDRMMAAVPRTRATILAGVCVVVGLPLIVSQLLEPLPDNHGTYQWFWASSEFNLATEEASRSAGGSSVDLRLYWVRRLAKCILDLAQGFAFLLLLVPRRATWFTAYGKYTLYPFLLHEVALFHRNELIKMLPLPVVTSAWGHFFVLVSQYAVIVCITVILSSSYVRSACGLILEPKWLERILYGTHTGRPAVLPITAKPRTDATAALTGVTIHAG